MTTGLASLTRGSTFFLSYLSILSQNFYLIFLLLSAPISHVAGHAEKLSSAAGANECDYFLRRDEFIFRCVRSLRLTRIMRDNRWWWQFFFFPFSSFLYFFPFFVQTYANSRVKFMLFYNWKERPRGFFFPGVAASFLNSFQQLFQL